MILVLKTADFSADNLGKVQVTTELHQYTKAAIEACGNTNLSNEQKSALNELFIAMGVDGSNDVMSKVRRLYIPMIAGNVGKALINYNTINFAIDKNLTDEYWTLRNNGLVGLKNGQDINLVENNPIMADDMCIMFLRTEKMVVGVDDSSFSLILRGIKNPNLFLGLRQQSISNDESISFGEYGAPWGFIGSKVKDSIKTRYVNSAMTFYDKEDGLEYVHSDTPYKITTDMSVETSQTLYAFGLNSVQTSKSYGFAMISESLTSQQVKNIASKVNALYQAFVDAVA